MIGEAIVVLVVLFFLDFFREEHREVEIRQKE
jgi:hypothetical protein